MRRAGYLYLETTTLQRHSGEGTMWLYEARINWPPEATRVAVTVEELNTGARGTGVAELPKGP